MGYVLRFLLADSGELFIQTPRFVRDTSQLWHRPNISRDEGIYFCLDAVILFHVVIFWLLSSLLSFRSLLLQMLKCHKLFNFVCSNSAAQG